MNNLEKVLKEDQLVNDILKKNQLVQEISETKKVINEQNKNLRKYEKSINEGQPILNENEFKDYLEKMEETKNTYDRKRKRLSNLKPRIKKNTKIVVQYLIEKAKQRGEAFVVTIGNYKGGAGKTTNTVNLGYALANFGLKVLAIDMDAQTNTTNTLMITKSNLDEDEVIKIKKTLMQGVIDGDISDAAIEITKNLSLIPNSIEFKDFAKYLYRTYENDDDIVHILSDLIKPIKKDYDVILIDVPPLNIETTRNSIMASDYVVIALQASGRSLDGAEEFVREMAAMQLKYGVKIETAGVLPVIMKKKRRSDEFVLEDARDIFGDENMFKQIIPTMDRLPQQDLMGITNNDRHDKNILKFYEDITREFMERIYYFE